MIMCFRVICVLLFIVLCLVSNHNSGYGFYIIVYVMLLISMCYWLNQNKPTIFGSASDHPLFTVSFQNFKFVFAAQTLAI